MTSREEEDAWRAIVDNYGERPTLSDDEPAPRLAPPAAPSPPLARRPAEPAPVEPAVPAEERFVPPTPPPVPRPKAPRLLAWLGVLGVPVLLVLTMILTVTLPPTVTTLLVVWFLGSFLYLVSQMPRQRDDPWDDGAVV